MPPDDPHGSVPDEREIEAVWLCPTHAEEFWVPHGGRCPAPGCDETLVRFDRVRDARRDERVCPDCGGSGRQGGNTMPASRVCVACMGTGRSLLRLFVEAAEQAVVALDDGDVSKARRILSEALDV